MAVYKTRWKDDVGLRENGTILISATQIISDDHIALVRNTNKRHSYQIFGKNNLLNNPITTVTKTK